MMEQGVDAADGPDWGAVRADYEARAMTLTEIAAKHRITQGQLGARRNAEGWPRRTGTKETRAVAIEVRILRLIDRQLARLEREFEDKTMSSNEMRLIEAMTKTMDHLIAKESSKTKAMEGKIEKPKMDGQLMGIRDKLIKRMEELNRG